MLTDPVIVPEQPANVGDVIEHEGQHFTVVEHFAQGKNMKDRAFSHIMFNRKGAFGLSVVE